MFGYTHGTNRLHVIHRHLCSGLPTGKPLGVDYWTVRISFVQVYLQDKQLYLYIPSLHYADWNESFLFMCIAKELVANIYLNCEEGLNCSSLIYFDSRRTGMTMSGRENTCFLQLSCDFNLTSRSVTVAALSKARVLTARKRGSWFEHQSKHGL